MSELYDRADNMFGELVIPESFSEALSYAEQLIWLYLHKQNELIEGENITITDNGDGTATISASMDNVKGIDRIESTVGTDKTVVVIYYTDGTYQSFNVLAGPQGPQGIQGIPGQDGAPGAQGDPGLGIKSIVVTNVETATVEVKGTRINPDESSTSQSFQKQVPKRSVLTITYDDDTTDTVYAYAGASTYVGETVRDLSVTPNTHTIKFKMYNPADGTIQSLQEVTIADGAQGPQGVPGQDGQDGQDGAPGATGATPNITMTASVLPTAGIPDVQISKTGTDENPNFALQFSGLKGENGQNGQDGVGVPTGGYTNYLLAKNSNSDYDTKWCPSLSGIGKLSISNTNWYTWREDGGTVTIQSNSMNIDHWLFYGAKSDFGYNYNPGYVPRVTINFRTFNIVSDMSANNRLGNISFTTDIGTSPNLGYGQLKIGGQTYYTNLLDGALAWLVLTDSNSNVITVPVSLFYHLYVLSYNSSTYQYRFKIELNCMLSAPLKAGTYTSVQLRR